jgi:hypothetical protein
MPTTRRAFAAAVLACSAALATSSFARAGDAVVFTFTSGTASAPGRVTVTNAASGSTISVGLLPNMSGPSCASMLAEAAPKVGFKTEVSGASVTVLGHGIVVKVEGASLTRSDR